MRIAMLSGSRYPPADGIGTYSLSLARGLVARGHSVSILTRGSHLGVRHMDGVRIVGLPFVPAYPLHVHIHGIFVDRYLERHPPDIIHAHSPLVPAPRLAMPLVTTLHVPVRDHIINPVVDVRSALNRLQVPFSERLERRLVRTSVRLAVVNPRLQQRLSAAALHRVPVSVLSNAVDVIRFFPHTPSRDPHTVLSVGRLDYGKGFEDLLTAWGNVSRLFPSARLLIVGDGPMRSRLHEHAEREGVRSSVDFLGEIPHEDPRLPQLYQRAAVTVQPSHHEGLSTVVLEAMASGSAIVATDVGGHASVIEMRVDGLLARPRDPKHLAEVISLALSGLGIELGTRARAKAVRSYSWDRLTHDYEDWYVAALKAYRSAADVPPTRSTE
jgi:glycosyltransferase involved in cell wall biosynthesis